MDINKLSSQIKPLNLSVKPVISTEEQKFFRHYKINFEEKNSDITHYFGHFPSHRFEIVAHYFHNSKASKTCFILHGYYDHAGLYSHIIDYCLKKNFSVVIYDLPGHGLSTGKQACINDFSDYQLVFNDVVSFFSEKIATPWYAIAQSTGAAILMDYLLNDPKYHFSKVILLAPLLQPVKWKMSLLLYEISRLFVERIPRKFSNNSHDEYFIEFLKKNDPLQYRHLPMKWVGALKKWIQYFNDLPSCEKALLIIQGQQDETVDWQYNIPRLKNKFPKAKVLYLQQGRHQLANESMEIRAKMFSAMNIYLDAEELIKTTPGNV